MVVQLQVDRPQRVFCSPLRAFVLVFYWLSSTAAMDNNSTLNNTTTKTPNGSEPKPSSCEWKDLEFPITYGPGIASSLCVIIGGFHVILGENKMFRCPKIISIATFGRIILAWLISPIKILSLFSNARLNKY